MQRESEILLLELFSEGDRIEFSVQEGLEVQARTLQHYESRDVDWNSVHGRCSALFQVFQTFNRDGRLSERSLAELESLGGLLSDELFPPMIKEQLLHSRSSDMVIRIDNGLVRIPWELLHDGQQFFCRRWNMGRLVRTPQKLYRTSARDLGLPLKMILVADPRGDLPAAYREGCLLRDLLDEEPGKIETELLCHQVDAGMVLGRIKECEILHYAGHADFVSEDPGRSGWLLYDGKVTAAQVMGMQGGRSGPSLVFVNACLSGQTLEWASRGGDEIYGLANAFLLAGARHYVGTFWDVQDEPSSRFATHFYRGIASGRSVGCAVRDAREEIVRECGEEGIVWATYMLYGDPSFVYVQEKTLQRDRCGTVPKGTGDSFAAEPRMRGGTGPHSPEREAIPENYREKSLPGRKGFSAWIRYGLLAALIAVLLGGWHLCRSAKGGSGIDSLLLDTEAAIYSDGRIPELLSLYEDTLKSPDGNDSQRAELHSRVGRLYAQRGDHDKALEHYQAAMALQPGNRGVQSDLCLSLSRLGRFAEARECTSNILASAPEDEIAQALNRRLEDRLSLEVDRARRERADALMNRLSARMKSDEGAAERTAVDLWTSRPLTLVLLDLEEQGGLSNRAGETEALVFFLLQRLEDSPRIRIVDRALFEKVLEELDLGAGKLSDPVLSLHLGGIFSARLLGHGTVYRDRESVKINLKFIETETTSLRVALSQTFPKEIPLEKMAEQIAERILGKIEQSYPLRGKILSVEGKDDVWINIGAQVGLDENILLNVLPPGKSNPNLILARLRILSVEDNRSRAEILDHARLLTPGCRVLETVATGK